MTDLFQKTESGSFEFISEDAILTPADTDVFLKRLNNELGRSQLALKRAREAELQAEYAYMTARAPLLLAEDCPEVGKRAGQVSQKAQEQWFADRVPDEYWTLRAARVERQNAHDYVWQVKAQVELMRSINVNAKAMYDTPGRGR